jgi:hypothetical protein
LQGPRTIECREIKLWGRDAEGAIISGPGRIQVISETDIRFRVGTARASEKLTAENWLTEPLRIRGGPIGGASARKALRR